MGRLSRLAARGSDAVRKAYKKVETRVLVAQGRKAVRARFERVSSVSRKAAKAGLLAGAVAAAGVLVREVRKRAVRSGE
jgi:hypothetical protein